jgi:hypothetical protein
MERGIVLSPQFIRRPVGDVLFKSAVDDLELRKYLLYWDKINVPRSTFVDFDCEQFKLLEHCGVLQRTLYGPKFNMYAFKMEKTRNSSLRNIHCGQGVGIGKIIDSYDIALDTYVGEQILDAHNDVFALLDSQEPGCWSKAQMSEHLISFDNLRSRALEINLYNILPVPSPDTNLEDILEFRQKRQAELLAFRCYIDELYSAIQNSQDPARAYTSQFNKLNLSLIDLNTTMNVSKIKVVVDSLRSVFNSADSIIGTGITVGSAQAVASYLSWDPLIAGIAAAGLVLAPKLIPKSSNTLPQHMTYIKDVRSTFK